MTCGFKDILLLARDKEDEQKVKMILNESHPSKNLSVPDPYYGGNDGFENVYSARKKTQISLTSKVFT